VRRLLFAVLILASCSPTARRPDGRTAQRIVSLLPSFTEILFAIGAGERLVGRTTWCDYPPAASDVPSVGDGMPPNVEAVAARKPDLVVLYNSGPNVTAAQQLERLGIQTVLLELNRLEDLGPATRRLGQLTGLRHAADSLAAAMDSLSARPPPAATTSIAFVVWDNPPIIIGRGSYATITGKAYRPRPMDMGRLAWLLFGEQLGPLGVFGAALLLSAIGLLYRGEARRTRAVAVS